MSAPTTEQETTGVDVEPIPVYEEDEVPASKPRFFVAGSTFFAQTDEGELRIPLRFKTKLLRQIRDLPDEIDQVFALLDGIGDKATAEKLDELDVLDTTETAAAYFQAWQEKNEARLGELRRSSRS